MTLVVHAWGAYATYGGEWRSDDYIIYKAIKALKGDSIVKYATIPAVNGKVVRIDQDYPDNQKRVVEVVSLWAHKKLISKPMPVTPPIVLVAVPSSKCITFGGASAPQLLADRLSARLGKNAPIGHWLRFVREMPRSHEGGGREQAVIEEALRVNAAKMKPGTRVVLVDDVKTSGAHLRACASALREKGCIVETALVAGRTAQMPFPNPFDLQAEDLE